MFTPPPLADLLQLSASKCAEQFTLLRRKIMFAVGPRRFVVQAKQVIGCDFQFDGNPGHDIGCWIAQAFLVAMDLTNAETESLGKLLLSVVRARFPSPFPLRCTQPANRWYPQCLAE